MSRAGRQARMRRLIERGEWKPAADWTPSASLKPPARTAAAAEKHRRCVLAECEAWISAVGTYGWQVEQDRRRGERNARRRAERQARAQRTEREEGAAA